MSQFFNPQLKRKNEKDLKYRKFIESLPCMVPGCMECREGYVAAHHCRNLGGGGIGLKPSDFDAVPLCDKHHKSVHQKGWSVLNLDTEYLLICINRYLTEYIQILQGGVS